MVGNIHYFQFLKKSECFGSRYNFYLEVDFIKIKRVGVFPFHGTHSDKVRRFLWDSQEKYFSRALYYTVFCGSYTPKKVKSTS